MQTMPLTSRHLIFLIPLLLVLLILTAFFWQGAVFRSESEYHELQYEVSIVTPSVLENVTIILPVPFVQNYSLIGEALIQEKEMYVPADWNLSLESINGSPMLRIFAPKIVPSYHPYPIPIEPGSSQNLTIPPTATEYSNATPVLMPLGISIAQRVQQSIDTRHPLQKEPLLLNPDSYQSISCDAPSESGQCYWFIVPIYIQYASSDRSPLTITLVNRGTNQWWEWGWSGNSYDELIEVTVEQSQQGWILGRGCLSTGNGRY